MRMSINPVNIDVDDLIDEQDNDDIDQELCDENLEYNKDVQDCLDEDKRLNERTILSDIQVNLELPDYSDKHKEVEEDSAFFVGTEKSGYKITVKKTGVCYVLRQNYGSLSSDRLVRVQSCDSQIKMNLSSAKSNSFYCIRVYICT